MISWRRRRKSADGSVCDEVSIRVDNPVKGTKVTITMSEYGLYAKLMAFFLRLLKKEVEDTIKRWIYEVCKSEMSVLHHARIWYSGCVSVYVGMWSNEFLGSCFSLSNFECGILIMGLMNRPCVLVSFCDRTSETKPNREKTSWWSQNQSSYASRAKVWVPNVI